MWVTESSELGWFHSHFIEVLVRLYKPFVYLELGVGSGETFRLVSKHVYRSIGVDTEEVTGLDGEIHQCTTREFFSACPDVMADMIFIDADHSYSSVKQDLHDSIAHLNFGGLIIVHDTDPKNGKFMSKDHCSDCHKVVDFVEESSDLNIVTMPISNPGLSLITRKCETRVHRRRSF